MKLQLFSLIILVFVSIAAVSGQDDTSDTNTLFTIPEGTGLPSPDTTDTSAVIFTDTTDMGTGTSADTITSPTPKATATGGTGSKTASRTSTTSTPGKGTTTSQTTATSTRSSAFAMPTTVDAPVIIGAVAGVLAMLF